MSFPNMIVREQCRVTYPYPAQNEDELALSAGQIVTIISKDVDDDGWWRGEVDGREGVFPNNFVVMVGTTVMVASPASAAAPPVAAAEEPATFPTQDHRRGSLDSNVYPPSAQKPKPPPPQAKPSPNKPLLFSQQQQQQPRTPSVNDKAAMGKTMIKEEEDSSDLDLDAVAIHTEKLSHPNVGRPKPKGRRPPSGVFGKGEDNPDSMTNGSVLLPPIKESPKQEPDLRAKKQPPPKPPLPSQLARESSMKRAGEEAKKFPFLKELGQNLNARNSVAFDPRSSAAPNAAATTTAEQQARPRVPSRPFSMILPNPTPLSDMDPSNRAGAAGTAAATPDLEALPLQERVKRLETQMAEMKQDYDAKLSAMKTELENEKQERKNLEAVVKKMKG